MYRAIILSLLTALGLIALLSSFALASGGNRHMTDSGLLVDWRLTQSGNDTPPADITLFKDRRLGLGSRFGDKVFQLDDQKFNAVRDYIFAQQNLPGIEQRALLDAVATARADVRRATENSAAVAFTAPQLDAGTTIIRADINGEIRQISYHDLVGDARAFPQIDALQRLRRIEEKLLELLDLYKDK